MTDDWLDWKVGDKVKSTENAKYIGLLENEVYTVTYICTLCVDLKSDEVDDFSTRIYACPDSNPSNYFFIISAAYQKGDRVIRNKIDNGLILEGQLGTVDTVTSDSVCIVWDNCPDTPQVYAWPARAGYFSKVSTLQSPRPVLRCSRCDEAPHALAEPNQPDGTFKCWLCRKYRFR